MDNDTQDNLPESQAPQYAPPATPPEPQYQAPSYDAPTYSPPESQYQTQTEQNAYTPSSSSDPQYQAPSYNDPLVVAPAPQYTPATQLQDVPGEIKGWNWGAFIMAIPWGIGNKVYFALLTLIPVIGWIFYIICGIYGNEWAWKAGNYTDIELFKKVQEPWDRAGKVSFFILLGIFALYFLALFLMIAFGAALFSTSRLF